MAINENTIRNNITKQVQNQIAQQRQSINNGLATQKREFDNTINQNKAYLDEQIKGMNTQRIQNDDKITTLQNRRGGFYSGGLDYQLSENLKNTQTQQGNLTKDINRQNNDILGKYNTLASQAANQIKLLETQAPDKIRELVNAELERQRAIAFEREKWDWQKAQAARSSRGGGGGGGGGSYVNTAPKSKDQTYADWTGYFQQNADNIANMGLPEFEQQLRENKSMMNQIQKQGYNVNAVIDALYAGGTGGRFKTKADYDTYMNQESKRQHSSGGRAVR